MNQWERGKGGNYLLYPNALSPGLLLSVFLSPVAIQDTGGGRGGTEQEIIWYIRSWEENVFLCSHC